jgi:hypothetical protein
VARATISARRKARPTRAGPGLLAVVCTALLGCGQDAAHARDAGAAGAGAQARGDGRVGGAVVSTVHGEAITRGEVELVARETGLSPLEALRRLQEEHVLAAHAVAAGHGDAPEVEDAARRAAVQALLAARIESEITPASVPEESVRERREQQRARFQRPERRRSAHLVARVAPDAPPEAWAAAERFVRRAIERLRAAEDPVAEARAIAEEAGEGRTFRAVFEELPPVHRDGGLAPEYIAPLFAARELGVLPEPVRTSFGYHAILLQEILFPWEAPPEEVEATIRRELCLELRARRLDEMLAAARRRIPVVMDEEAVRRLLTFDLEGGREDRGGADVAPGASP